MKNNFPKERKKILWMGHWHSDTALFQRKAVNQAATRWSRDFLYTLSRHGCEISVCTHCREQVWPFGQLLPGDSQDLDHTFPVNQISYVNLPLVRDVQLVAAYRKAVRYLKNQSQPNFVFTYNLLPYHCAAGSMLAQDGIKWIPVILDQDDPETDNWDEFNKLTKDASGIIFLSAWGYHNYPGNKPCFHLDGGIAKWHGGQKARDEKIKTIVYSGKYDERYGGLDLLFEILKGIRHHDYRVLLTGKDPKGRVKRILKSAPKAEYLGFLSEKELHDVYTGASLFINPRPPHVSDNRMIFPSKLHQYLAYGRPVISSWTGGLSAEYKNLLLVPQQNEPEAYARLIDSALSLEAADLALLAGKIETWAIEHTWEKQVERLMNWLNTTWGT